MTFVAATLRRVPRRDAPSIRGAAARQDEGQGIVLGPVALTFDAAVLALRIDVLAGLPS